MSTENIIESATQWNKEEVYQVEFTRDFIFHRDLAEGAQGTVSLWSARFTGEFVVVKEPKLRWDDRTPLQKETDLLRQLPDHDHIVKFFGFFGSFNLAGPAPILEFSPIGDLIEYRELLLKTEARVPEMTIWKLFRDMALGLDWLHNCCDVSYIHNDLKPDNILAFPSKSYGGGSVPLLPTFKICDMGRTGTANESEYFQGTPEYGPPMEERVIPQTAAVDMWSLGATIQKIALCLTHDLTPLMPHDDFMEYAEKKLSPDFVDELLEGHREERYHAPPVYRPLHESMEYQKTVMHFTQTLLPYSKELNGWYSMLYELDPLKRVKSYTLRRDFVPVAEEQIKTLKKRRMAHVLKKYAKAQTQVSQP